MAAPDCLYIGAQKAGTTWLHTVLKSHKDVWLPPVKELQFLNEYYMRDSFRWTSDHRLRHATAEIRRLAQANSLDIKRIHACAHIVTDNVSYKWYEV